MKTNVMLNLEGGSGEKPRSPNDPPEDPRSFELTPEFVAALTDEQLRIWHVDQLRYDTTGGDNVRLIRREMKHRARASVADEVWNQLR